MTISERITDNWPVTEATLSAEVSGYEDIKLRAIARAARELYGVDKRKLTSTDVRPPVGR